MIYNNLNHNDIIHYLEKEGKSKSLDWTFEEDTPTIFNEIRRENRIKDILNEYCIYKIWIF